MVVVRSAWRGWAVPVGVTEVVCPLGGSGWCCGLDKFCYCWRNIPHKPVRVVTGGGVRVVDDERETFCLVRRAGYFKRGAEVFVVVCILAWYELAVHES